MAQSRLLLLLPIALALLILASGEGKAQSVESQIMEPHNQARLEVGVTPLVWSHSLAAYAQLWANNRAEQGCTSLHSNGNYGENISRSSGTSSPASVVASWVAEKPYYDYDTNSCTPGHNCHHYTQIVWRRTREVGCAQAACVEATITVCSYDPPGNLVGERPY